MTSWNNPTRWHAADGRSNTGSQGSRSGISEYLHQYGLREDWSERLGAHVKTRTCLLDLRTTGRVVSHAPESQFLIPPASSPSRNRTWSSTSARLRASTTLTGPGLNATSVV